MSRRLLERTAPRRRTRGYFTQNGFYDDASAKLNKATVGLQATSRVVSLLHEGNTIGKRFIGMAGAFSGTYDRVLERGKLHKANVQVLGLW